MADNKTKPSPIPVSEFLEGVSETRQNESKALIDLMQKISGENAVMWGPSIIGFGSVHYRYETGREGDMPAIGFSPRKANLTIYIADGFHNYGELLDKLGPHKTSVSCLYISNLAKVNLNILEKIIQKSYQANTVTKDTKKAGWTSVEEYIDSLRGTPKKYVQMIRTSVKKAIPKGNEAISYQVPTMKLGGKNVVHYAGYKDHVSIYPVPQSMVSELKAYQRGKGTLWFRLDEPLPMKVIEKVIAELLKAAKERAK